MSPKSMRVGSQPGRTSEAHELMREARRSQSTDTQELWERRFSRWLPAGPALDALLAALRALWAATDGGDASGLQVGQDEVGVVSLVGKQDAGLRAGLVHDRPIALYFGDLPAAQRDRDREAQSVAAEMDLGREATSKAAKTLVLIPFVSAPAACWWARMMVESIIWTLSWPAPVSFSASSITSQTPARVQRRNWR